MRWLERPPGPAVVRCFAWLRWSALPLTGDPAALKAFIKDNARGSPSNTTSSYLLVTLLVEVCLTQVFLPLRLVLVRTAKLRLPHQFAFPIIPSPTPTTLHVFNLL